MPVDVRTLEPLLAELNEKIDKLRVAFEQYYLGIELMPPEKTRREIQRAFYQMQGTMIANTALKFRYQSLCQKWTTYGQYWGRVQREIENGTYIRHLKRLARKQEAANPADLEADEVHRLADAIGAAAGAGAPGEPPPSTSELGGEAGGEAGGDLGDWLDAQFSAMTSPESTRPPGHAPAGTPPLGAATAPPAAPRPAPRRSTLPPIARPDAPSPVPGMTSMDLDRLYHHYIATRKRLGESTEGIDREVLASNLARQMPTLLEKHKDGVDFQVQEKDGRAVVKAVPRKGR